MLVIAGALEVWRTAMPAVNVVLSTTFLEFEAEREVLHRVLTNILGVACDRAEYLTPQSHDVEAELKNRIDNSEIVVLLLVLKYGSLSGNIYWTEKEIQYAYRKKKKTLPYFEKQSVPSTSLDIDEQEQNALEKFIECVEKKVTPCIPRFSEVEDSVALVVRDVLIVVQRFDQHVYWSSFAS